MFGIGTWELVVIVILALLIVGPDKLPSLARSVGRTLTKLRQAADEVKREIDLPRIERELREEVLGDPAIDELKQALDFRSEIRQAMAELEAPPPLPGPSPAPEPVQPAPAIRAPETGEPPPDKA